MRGRRPEPAERKALKGNPGRRPLPATASDDNEPVAVGGDVPANLCDRAGQVWRVLVPLLESLRFVRATDRATLERYCNWTVRFWEANDKLDEDAAVYETSSPHIARMLRVNPWFLVLCRSEKILQDLEDRIGLNPTARQRILMAKAAGAVAPENIVVPRGTGGTDAQISAGGQTSFIESGVLH